MGWRVKSLFGEGVEDLQQILPHLSINRWLTGSSVKNKKQTTIEAWGRRVQDIGNTIDTGFKSSSRATDNNNIINTQPMEIITEPISDTHNRQYQQQAS